MKLAIFFLALIGLGSALQQGMTYTYKYEGRVATGIPKIRNQAAGTGIKAEVQVTMKSRASAIVKLNHVQVGEYHGPTSEEMRASLPIQYQPISTGAQAISEPFGVNFLQTEGDVMEVSRAEEEWVTNIKKAIVNVLRIAPVRVAMDTSRADPATNYIRSSSHGQITGAFSLMEDTILGRCLSEYTLTPLTQAEDAEENAKIKQQLKQDDELEGKKSSQGRKLESTLFRAVRSINLDNCQDRAVLQHAGVGNTTDAGSGHFTFAQTRGSSGEYIVRGSPGNFRVERALVEGALSINPYGYKTEPIVTYSNQTMELISSSSVAPSVKMPNPTRQVKSWIYEVRSPYSAPSSGERSWVNFAGQGPEQPLFVEAALSGLPMTSEIQNQFVRIMTQCIEQAVKYIKALPQQVQDQYNPADSKAGITPALLHRAATLAQGLTKQQIEQVWSQLAQGANKDMQKQVLADALAASGSQQAVKVLLEKMQSKDISAFRAASILTTLPNNVLTPVLVKDLINFVKTIDMKQHPLLASAAFINVATMAKRQCASAHYKNFTVPTPLLGNQICDRSAAEQDLLSFLKNALQSASSSWERAIVAQAMGNLGAHEVVSELRPVVLGHTDPNPRVRITALYALAQYKLPTEVRHRVFELLMPIVENHGENPEIRQIAFLVLTTWHPDAGWWHRMASSTWREPSRNMASFISSTISSFAKFNDHHLLRQSKICSQVQHITKPAYPGEYRSYNKIIDQWNSPLKLQRMIEFAWVFNGDSMLPREVELFYQACLGGFHVRLGEFHAAAAGLEPIVQQILARVHGGQAGQEAYAAPGSAEAQMSQEANKRFMERVNPTLKSTGKPEAYVFAKILDNIQMFAPLNKQVIDKVRAGEPNIWQLLQKGIEFSAAKYVNPVISSAFFASEVGLPVQSLVMTPTVASSVGSIKLHIVADSATEKMSFKQLLEANLIEFQVETNTKFEEKFNSVIKINAPYLAKAVVAGVDSLKNLNLPLKAKISTYHSKVTGGVQVIAEPLFSAKTPLAHVHNYPFTMTRPILPIDDLEQERDLKVVKVVPQKFPLFRQPISFGQKVAGVDAQIIYEADLETPFTPTKVAQYLRHPASFYTMLGSPSARFYRASLNVNPSSSSSKIVRLSAAYMHQPVSQQSAAKQPFKVEDTDAERAAKLGPFSKAVRVKAVFAENKPAYEAALAWTPRTQGQITKTMVLAGLMRSEIPNYAPAGCAALEMDVSHPSVQSLAQFKSVINGQPQISAKGELHLGPSCPSAQSVAQFNANFRVSSERLQQIRQEMQEQVSSLALTNYPDAGFPIPAVYDQAEVSATWEQQQLPTSFINATYIAQELIRGAAYPHLYINHMAQGQQGKLEITGQRTLEAERWSFWAQLPNKKVIIENVRAPLLLDQVVPIGGVYAPSTPQLKKLDILAVVPSNTCVIRPNKVATFDGTKVPVVGEMKCWTVAAVDIDQAGSLKRVEIRKSSPDAAPEVRVVMAQHNVLVEATEQEVQVNGHKVSPSAEEQIKDAAGRTIGVIKKSSSGLLSLKFPGFATVFRSSNHVEIHAAPQYKGLLSGLCGTFDGESTHDMVGPAACIYRDAKLFKDAWSTFEGPQCDATKMSEVEQKLNQYRQHCPTAAAIKGENPHITAMHMSHPGPYVSGFAVQEFGHRICVSTKTASFCAVGYRPTGYTTFEAEGKCWAKEKAPKDVMQAFQTFGFMPRQPTEKPEIVEHKRFRKPTRCAKM